MLEKMSTSYLLLGNICFTGNMRPSSGPSNGASCPSRGLQTEELGRYLVVLRDLDDT